MLKDLSELIIGEVYQFKNNEHDILGFYKVPSFDENNEIYGYWFNTISSAGNKWTSDVFFQTKESVLKTMTKL
jgi:hypothetical protein